MVKPFTYCAGCLTAAAALALILSVSQSRAQERVQSAPMGSGMMTPGTGPHGTGAMVPGSGPHGTAMTPGSGREAMERTERAPRGREGWRERRRARRMARRMEILDTNGDGKVTLAEIDAELKRLVAAADVNGDGKLSADEFRRRGRWFLRLRVVSFFDMLDANGDGQISVAEMLSPTGRWFKRQDDDKDKALSVEELDKSSWRHGGEERREHRR